MVSGCIRAVALIAVGALLGSANCYGDCLSAACRSVQLPSSGCHHHKSSHDDQPGCVHHPDFTGPEAGSAKVGVAKAVPVVAPLTTDSTSALMEPPLLMPRDTGSPPDRLSSRPISALRI